MDGDDTICRDDIWQFNGFEMVENWRTLVATNYEGDGMFDLACRKTQAT